MGFSGWDQSKGNERCTQESGAESKARAAAAHDALSSDPLQWERPAGRRRAEYN